MVMIERGDKNISPKLTNLLTKTQNIINQDSVESADVRGQFYQKLGFLLCGVVILSAGSFLSTFGIVWGKYACFVCRGQFYRDLGPSCAWNCHPLHWLFFDLISKPQEGSTRASLLGMLVTGKGISAFPRQLQLPAFFSLLLREKASGRGGSFKD
jgi:hypothetical protein